MESYNLLLGEIININAWEIMSAVLLLSEGNKIKFDESNLNGQSKHIKKNIDNNCIIRTNKGISRIILSGAGWIEWNTKVLVIAVGKRS